MKTVAFHTLGCKVNQYDTQAMLEKFRAAGYEVVPFETAADVYVINTCTVTGTGDKKSMQLTRRLRREHPESHIILAGCLAQRKGSELLETGARLVIGTQNRDKVVELLEQAVANDTGISAVNELNAATPFEELTEHSLGIFTYEKAIPDSVPSPWRNYVFIRNTDTDGVKIL
jgi:threonylcarbamoyladenosine tRNA methylthiotransferase MtaB